MKLIIRKDCHPKFLSLRMVREYRFKIVAKIFKLYWKLKGYEVEELDL